MLRVYAQYRLAALEVGQLDGDAAVESARARQRGVERLGPVGRGEYHDAVVALEAVHLGQQLVQRLLALVVAHRSRVAALADRVYFVDEYDAGGFLLRLLEEVAHLRRAHADEHLYEFGARYREEGHVRLARDGLREHRLARTRRAD